MGALDNKMLKWIDAGGDGNTIVKPDTQVYYRVELSWGEPGSLMLATDGVYYFPLCNMHSDEWRWECTLLGKDAGDIIIAQIMKHINEQE